MLEHIHAHEYTSENREALQESDLCGCFGCRWIYEASEVNEWTGDTAICARCNIDGVLPDNAGYVLTDDFLKRMHNYWLGEVKELTTEELVEESNIENLNKYWLSMKGFRIEINDELTERFYLVYEGKEEFYFTKNPRELLIKVAQFLPDSDVKIETEEISIGDEKVQQEKMIIRIHQQNIY